MYIFKKHNFGLIITILLVVMAVVSCRGETPTLASTPTLHPSPTTSTRVLQPTPSPIKVIKTPTTPTLPSETPCPSCGSMEEQAREALAHWLGISAEEIEVIKVEEVEWPDTSLGCPQPGMVYAQVIVPGWKVVMRVKSKVFEYHTGGGGRGVLCDQEGVLLHSQ